MKRPFLVALLLAALAAGVASVPGVASAAVAPPGWEPGVEAAREYAHLRRGNISFAVRAPGGRFWGYRTQRTAPSASVLKAMLMVGYLNSRGVRDRPLRRSDMALIEPMVRWSDNATATRIRSIIGNRGLRRLARKVGMKRFHTASLWGLSRISAADQTLFFLDLERFVVPRHRAVALDLLSRIVRSQRWGIGQVHPPGWQLYFKGGWGSGTGAVDHQVALLTRGDQRISVAILTTAQGTHSYGKQTLRGIAKRLLAGLDRVPRG